MHSTQLVIITFDKNKSCFCLSFIIGCVLCMPGDGVPIEE